MTAIWFLLALVMLVAAGVLLYLDRSRRGRTGRVREIWAKAQGYKYTGADSRLPGQFHRAVMTNHEYLGAVDVVTGERHGDKFILFDLEDTATIVAVEREVGSDVDIELRLKATAPPKGAELELLGAIGQRVVFATDPEIARRACDQRMVAFTESIPAEIGTLWSEGEWTLGSLPLGSSGRDWDAAIETVARLSGILRVLPPVIEPRGMRDRRHDPGRPGDNEPRRVAASGPAPAERAAATRKAPERRPTAAPQRPERGGRGNPEPGRPERPPRPNGERASTTDRPSRPVRPVPDRTALQNPARQNPDRPALQNPARQNLDRPPLQNPARPNPDRPTRPNSDRPARPNSDRPARPNPDRPARPNSDRPARPVPPSGYHPTPSRRGPADSGR